MTQRGPGRICPVRTSEAVVTWGRCTPGIAGTRGTAPVATTTDSASSLSTSARSASALGRTRGDQDLAAEGGRRLQQRHLVATQRGHPRRLETSHAASDHEHAARPPGGRDDAELLLAPDQRVLNTGDRLALE